MDELRTFESSSRPERIPSSTSDIKSDYFKEMKRGGGGDSTTLSSTSNNEGNGGDGTADQIEMAVRLPVFFWNFYLLIFFDVCKFVFNIFWIFLIEF
jgi:hypothetical protein